MTYGRRAQAARRVSAPGSAFGSGSSKPPSSDTPQPLDLSDSSVEESDGEPLAAGTSTGTWARRTAHSALSRLEQLYESTRSQGSTPSGNSTDAPGGSASSRSILDQTKNRWDLGDVLGGKPERAVTDSKETDQQQRIVLDNTDMFVSAEEAAKVKAKAKRLQSRAFSHNVVFTYGRPRSDDSGDDDDYDGSELSKFRRPSGSSRSLNMRPLLLLDQDSSALAGGAIGAYKSPQDPLSFRRLIGDILQRIGSTDSMRVSACGDLAARLGQQEFRDELLGSIHWLTTLLRSMQRVRECPLVSASMMVLVRAAFVNPEVMQSLVFDHHILEIVAEVLKATAQADILVQRDPSDFDCDSQCRCVTAICQTVRALGLVDDILAVSTYNLVLAALRSFMRDDDVAYLAMAELLRGELHESGCLALIVERTFARSIPAFVKQINSQPARSLDGSPFDDSFVSKVSARNAAAAAAADFRNGDDMWMDFDLPDESQHPASLRGLPNHRQQADKCTFRRELDPQLPSRLAVSLELELLKFSATASRENQDEILGEKAVVPAMLSLLAACQQSSVRLRGQSLVKALETAVLVLQLLVNLSNSSTEFCSQFIRQNGLEAVSKSIMFVSRTMADGMLQTESSSSNPASTGAANSSSTTAKDLGDLCYDTLLIAAALLTNIVDADSSTATHFSYVFQNPHCPLDSRCYPECACASRTSLVGLLARAFAVCHAMAAPADSSQSDALVAAGYLAVLLGFLMRDSPGSHRAILQHLPGQSAAAVVSRIEGFIRLTDSISERFGKLLGGLGTAAFGLPEPGSGRRTHLLGQRSTESPPSLSQWQQ
ncbi:hypothetical protein DL89DRAFT_292685 [Linderina pennispora]|uniref:Wings apart-like protein C-terminal domain-containing protein n=1 Tax=Linderina pennispora TaxID=61395 RepID=A0A1Y1WA38_9FUNG|nr:uncharacterized protein DL89DRAFT_292685 [Linderina pennispora]ORX70004.1 hypothetical protein DL89DRAFT_292685 [Linderina pennispora]